MVNSLIRGTYEDRSIVSGLLTQVFVRSPCFPRGNVFSYRVKGSSRTALAAREAELWLPKISR
jgi:hypothetical protein